VTVPRTAESSNAGEWTTANDLDSFATLCCQEPHLELLSDPQTLSLTQRVGGIGPVVVAEVIVGSDVEINCGALCGAYRVNVLRAGSVESTHRGSSLTAGAGTAAVYQPEGDARSRWVAGSRLLGVKIDRCSVEDAVSDELGRRLTSQIDFTPCMSSEADSARSWINMLSLFAEQLFQPDGLLSHPLAALPFVDSLVHGLLLAADNPHRGAITGGTHMVSPRAVRAAVEIIEEEAHLPLTVSSIAARCHVSVRALQQDFRRYMGASPMGYLREVRLSRAHQSLLESDPRVTTVATVAYHWGFTNLGRFAAAHTARYDEPPAATLRRRASRRSRADVRWER
jgi:AraC-like DNA-binding protein